MAKIIGNITTTPIPLTFGFDYYYETNSITLNNPDYQRVGIHKIKKTGSVEQSTIIMTQKYAGGLQQTVIRPNFIRLRQIKGDGTMTDWDDYVLNSKLEERLAELDNNKESLNGFDYYVYGEYVPAPEEIGGYHLKISFNGSEFGTYDYDDQIFDDMLDAGIYKIHIDNRESLMEGYPKYETFILIVGEDDVGEISQTLIYSDGTVKYRSSGNNISAWNPWEKTTVTVDSSLSLTSINPVQNKVVKAELDKKASVVYVDEKIASMVDSAPETLDTLNELATALGDDPNFATTVITQIGHKADKTSIKYYEDPDIVPTDASYFEYTDNGDGTCQITKLIDKTLTEVVIPYEINGLKVTSIGISAFRETGIISVILPNTITSIGNSAFRESTLASINIPNSVITIGTYVFYKCTSLTSIVLPNTITSIGQYAFSYSHITSIVLPDNITTIEQSTFFECNKLVSVFIPNSVTTIGKNAFHGCYWLRGINIPNSITSLGEQVFEDCENLTSIIIPNSVTNIGAYAFSGVTGIKNISIPNTITSIKKYTFTNCRSLKHVTIPNSITSIGEAAFMGCTPLKSITIPSSVTSIEKYAFGFSSINLTKIYCDKNSFAETYAIENNIPYEYIEAKDYIGYTSELNTEDKETVVGAINELAGKLISETDVDSKIAAMVDSAPETLDTLNELAEALGDDPNFATTVATEIGKKADAKTEDGGFKGGNGAFTLFGGAVGRDAHSEDGGAVGFKAFSVTGGAVGRLSETLEGGAVGNEAISGMGFSGGYKAQVDRIENGEPIDAIQLGTGKNSNPKTLQIYEHTLLNADGTIPEERLTKAKDYIDEKIGDIDTLLDSVLAIEQELIGEALVDTSIAVCDSYINGGNAE